MYINIKKYINIYKNHFIIYSYLKIFNAHNNNEIIIFIKY